MAEEVNLILEEAIIPIPAFWQNLEPIKCSPNKEQLFPFSGGPGQTRKKLQALSTFLVKIADIFYQERA